MRALSKSTWFRYTSATLGVALTALIVASLALPNAEAQQKKRRGRGGPEQGREVTLTGQIVDLHCAMTGQYPSEDRAKCTADCIRAGVPAALKIKAGFVVLGHGADGPAKAVLPHAFEHVDVTGKIYRAGGLRYLDIESIQPASGQAPAEEDEREADAP
jgi:hypothetical protein